MCKILSAWDEDDVRYTQSSPVIPALCTFLQKYEILHKIPILFQNNDLRFWNIVQKGTTMADPSLPTQLSPPPYQGVIRGVGFLPPPPQPLVSYFHKSDPPPFYWLLWYFYCWFNRWPIRYRNEVFGIWHRSDNRCLPLTLPFLPMLAWFPLHVFYCPKMTFLIVFCNIWYLPPSSVKVAKVY